MPIFMPLLVFAEQNVTIDCGADELVGAKGFAPVPKM